MDTWVSLDRFESLDKIPASSEVVKNGSSLVVATDAADDKGDRKMTRNQKRKHDEMNHIQTVAMTSN